METTDKNEAATNSTRVRLVLGTSVVVLLPTCDLFR